LGRGTPAPLPRSCRALPPSPVSESESRPAGVQCGCVRGPAARRPSLPLQSARCPGCGHREPRRTGAFVPVGRTSAGVPCGAAYSPEVGAPAARSAELPPVVPRRPTSRYVLSGQRGDGSFWGLTPCHPPGLHPHDPVPPKELLCSHHHIGDLGFPRRSVGGALSPQHGVCARVDFVARGQEVRAGCAAWAAPCGPAESLSDASVRCEGPARPRRGLGLLSSVPARLGGGVWVRQGLGPRGRPCPHAPLPPARLP